MKKPPVPLDPRAEELLADRAYYGADDAIAAELRALGVEDDTSFDVAAAAVALSVLPLEEMPQHVQEKILAQTPRAMGGNVVPLENRAFDNAKTLLIAPPSSVRPTAPAKTRSNPAPWIAAAACFVLAAGAWAFALTRPKEVRVVQVPTPPTASTAQTPPVHEPTLAEARAAIASAPDAVRADWKATKDPSAVGATGDVVWSASLQKGYMRFVGLSPNDKTQGQYQLWIFDKNRDAKFPVDGGVFDIASNGEVIVPIDSRLHVDDATLFAVTFEKPGGVVVSKRERMIVTAQTKPG